MIDSVVFNVSQDISLVLTNVPVMVREDAVLYLCIRAHFQHTPTFCWFQLVCLHNLIWCTMLHVVFTYPVHKVLSGAHELPLR